MESPTSIPDGPSINHLAEQAVEAGNERHYIAANCGELTLVPLQRD